MRSQSQWHIADITGKHCKKSDDEAIQLIAYG